MLGAMRSRACELGGTCMKPSHFYPLFFFVVPTAVIGFGLVIPHSCIAGVNDKTVGFAIALLSACVAYWQGVRRALAGARPHERGTDAAA